MGLCSSCFKGSSSDYVTPDMGTRPTSNGAHQTEETVICSIMPCPTVEETRRRQQVEAAERRQREQENRGIKDPEKVKRMQQRAIDLEILERETAKSSPDAPLKWQMN